MGRTAEAESLWGSLEALFAWRKHDGGRVDDAFGQLVTEKLRDRILGFVKKLLQDMQKQ
jgi:hypothetical protein